MNKEGDNQVSKKQVTNREERNNNDMVRCPNCSSSNIFFVTRETNSGYDGSNACCGAILFGPLGLLCGLTGKKESETIRKCGNCGKEF